MENKPNTLMICLGYGVIIALAGIVFSLILFVTGADETQSWMQNLTYIITLAGILWAQYNYRNKYNNGFITYGEAFKIGLLTVLFLSVITSIYTFIFFKFIDPGAMNEIMLKAEQSMLDQGRTDMEIEQGMKFMQMVNNVGWYTFFGFLGTFVIGIIISLITSAFIKKENTNFSQPNF
ncbi:MAG: DUF4199 domain-containing protein [Bacteroidales bacterium]|jgi:hypothetical protein|nr:DUF4199 domain-containing protein [Bacteroidales bacterium]